MIKRKEATETIQTTMARKGGPGRELTAAY